MVVLRRRLGQRTVRRGRSDCIITFVCGWRAPQVQVINASRYVPHPDFFIDNSCFVFLIEDAYALVQLCAFVHCAHTAPDLASDALVVKADLVFHNADLVRI